MFITVQLVLVDIERRQVTAASAGHCPVILSSNGNLYPLRVAGTPLGVLATSTYREQTTELGACAGMVLFTDGVTEALNPEGEMYGQDRLMQWLREHFASGATAPTIRDALAAEMAHYGRGQPLRDDQAFLVLTENALPAGSATTPTRTTGDFVGTETAQAAQNFEFPPLLPASTPP